MSKILKKNTKNTSVRVVLINSDGVLIDVSGRDFFLPYSRIPWFKNARVCDVMNVSNVGRGIRWENLDVDLEIDSLLHPEKYPNVMKRYPEEILTGV